MALKRHESIKLLFEEIPTMHRLVLFVVLIAVAIEAPAAEPRNLHTFERVELTDTYYSEGTNVGDLNNDGELDIVYGPYWFAGPDFASKHEIYRPVPQETEAYADHFFCWVTDFNGDQWQDILTVGFPGTPAYLYENPGTSGEDRHWPRHEVLDSVSNEAPQFANLIGDDESELICTRDGYFGYATPLVGQPFAPWTFHRLSRQVAAKRFGHGLGVGDINGDGRNDLLMGNGWYEQPASLAKDPQWRFHPFDFAPAAADLFAYDVDGDGDNDVITSLDAHGYGLAWYEQDTDGDAITFRKQTIMGKVPEDSEFGVVFTEPHSVQLVDVDGDGLKDICTGKTYYSHHRQSPMWDAGAVVYWFRLQRDASGVHWIPYQVDGSAGIGRQLIVRDVDDDGLPDFVTGGMKGCHLLRHTRRLVDADTWAAAQPRAVKPMASGLSPVAAAEQMTVPTGFHVELAAGEPMVHQPIAFTYDHRGRLWVAEAFTYPQRAPDGQGRDRIIILEDTDLDGQLDSRTLFAEGLNLVSGLEVGFGGVWVGAAPYLMFIPDADGDDRPDGPPEILLDGFGYQDTHEVLNAFIWGPDGWLYGCHGVFTHSNVGKPKASDGQRTPLNAGVWRYHPTQHKFDVFMHGTSNPWGVDFNDHGHAFITACVIPHMFHVIQGARYQRQGGQHFNRFTFDDIKTIADHAHYAGDIRDGAWWGHEPSLTPTNSAAGGGHAHCGAMIYLGDNWPANYRDSIYFNNVHGNRINNDILVRSGSGYVASHGKDFLMANDRYFRGINLKSGPDGTVHLIDWYDKNACHRTNPDVWDRSNGRIYRVRYGDVRPQAVDLSRLSDVELANLQDHDNEWHVRTARRLLQERAHQRASQHLSRNDATARGSHVASQTISPDAQKVLSRQFRNAVTGPKRLRALWALHAIDPSNAPLIEQALKDADETVRAWAIQLAIEPALSATPLTDRVARAHNSAFRESRFVARLTELAQRDDSQLVRLYLASALQRLPFAARWSIAEQLVLHADDADDPNIPLMIWYGVEPLVPADTNRAMRLASSSRIPTITRFITRRAAANDGSLNQVVESLVPGPSSSGPSSSVPSSSIGSSSARRLILTEILHAFEGRVDIPMPPSWDGVYAELLRDPNLAVRDQADRVAILLGDKRILPRLRNLVADANAAPEKRLEALNVLVRSRDTDAKAAFVAALSAPILRGPAIRALAAFDDPNATRAILQAYTTYDAGDRQDAISTLTARPNSAMALLDAIAQGQIPRSHVNAYHVRQLRDFQNTELQERLESTWGTIRETTDDKKQRIVELKAKFASEIADADVNNGRRIFNNTCASCHKLFGHGGDIGPDITGSNRADLEYILENVISPSAVVSKDFTMSTIHTVDGRAVTGLVLDETDSAIQLRTVNDTLLIAKSDIEDRVLSELSLMPDGQLDELTENEQRDLIAYLASPSQVPLPKTPSEIDPDTGKVPHAIEGESMQIAGKTDGDVRNQPMGGYNADRWSGNDHLWWTGQKDGSRLDLKLPVPASGTYRIETTLTCARDYGIVQLAIDGHRLGDPIDTFYANGVVTTGVISFDAVALNEGDHTFSATITGKNPDSVGQMFGLDYVRLVRTGPPPPQ